MIADAELLRRYAEEGSSDAFGELVRRNVDLVYAAALRRTGDPYRAQEVAQTVFVDLARKARSLQRHPSLVSWLYTSTRFAALKLLRTEQRRIAREQEAYAMQEISREDSSPDWERLRPVFDDVMHELADREREIILLRYFRGLSFAEVARLLATSEGAARMRLDRTLDRLNVLFTRRGISSSATALGVALAAHSGAAAPAGLAASIAGTALSTALSTSVTGTLAGTFVAMSKLKTAAFSALLLGGVTTLGIQAHTHRSLLAEFQTQSTSDMTALQTENQRLRAEVSTFSAQHPDLGELEQLRTRLAVLKARPRGVVDSELRPPRNLGRATPAAAIETFCWAINQGDLDLTASYVSFRDDTPENRAQFMGNFSPAIRERYRTPERLCAMAFFGIGLTRPNSGQTMQVLSVTEDHGPDQVKIKLWIRAVDGRESGGGDTFVRRADGWTGKPIVLLRPEIIQAVNERIEPASGNFIPFTPAATKPKS
jgi:RNA polymerase sigma factor (sigma-70 family)